MTVLRQNDEPRRTVVRETHWLATLEQELKSRVGWIDEAVSPFAGRCSARTRRQHARPALRAGKAA